MDEDEILLDAEVESIGVMHIHGDAKDWTAVWLSDWEASGAPEWFWCIHSGIARGKLEFKRYSAEADDWITVWTLNTKFADKDEENRARDLMKKVLGGYIPDRDETVGFGDL